MPAVIEDDVTLTFRALGDPVRRAIVERLAAGDATVNQLAALFPISLQAVSKHIKVLEGAGVVARGKVGQTRPVRLRAEPLEATAAWVEARHRHLERRHARLDDVLHDLQTREEPTPS